MTDVFSPIPELNLLKEFYDATLDDFWANGFEMYGFGKELYEDEDPRLADRLIYFAQANGSGSLYGIWRKDDREDLATLPVVAMGDEGGLHLVARNLREFFQLLGAFPRDAEPFIDWDSFGSLDGFEPVENEHYLAWLERTFGLPASTTGKPSSTGRGRSWGRSGRPGSTRSSRTRAGHRSTN